MPTWLTIALPILTLLVGGGGALAWVRYFHSEAPVADAGVIDTLASAKLKEAQATEVIAEAFTNTLASVRQLAEDRAKENADLRVDLTEAEKEIAGLKVEVGDVRQMLEELRHFLSPRGAHGEWDSAAHEAARLADPSFPIWPPPPAP